MPGVHAIPLGFVNAFLVEDGRELTLIDTGVPGSGTKIVAAVEQLGHRPRDVRRILVTHLHADHTGGLAVVKTLTGAEAWMHPADAELVARGVAARPMGGGPGLLGLTAGAFMRRRPEPRVHPAPIENLIEEGAEVPGCGLRAIHVPGHAAGQLAFHRPGDGGILFAADAAANLLGRVRLSVVYEDLGQGRRDAARLAGLDFEVACFGHGPALVGGASRKFKKRWGGKPADG